MKSIISACALILISLFYSSCECLSVDCVSNSRHMNVQFMDGPGPYIEIVDLGVKITTVTDTTVSVILPSSFQNPNQKTALFFIAESGVDYRVTTNRGDLFIIRLDNLENDNDGCCKSYAMDVITINGEENSCKLGCDPLFSLQL